MSDAASPPESSAGLDARLVVQRGQAFALDIEFRIEAGCTLALLGPNGAGKSTVISLLSGLLALDEGWIILDGQILDHPAKEVFVGPERRQMGVVFQDYLLFEHLDAISNVAFGLVSKGVKARAAVEQAMALLTELGIEDLAHQRPSSLSGGQAQRVALARALASNPRMLLLDEPLAALDIETRSSARRLLAGRLADFAGPRLIITHEPADAMLLADRIAVIENGTVTQCGTPDDVRYRPATPYVAALVGTNLLTGSNASGSLTLDHHPQPLFTDDTSTTGPVLITISPRAVALHPTQPHGSPRNTWRTEVVAVESLGETVRVQLGAPLPLVADITPGGSDALALAPGREIWAAVKATEVQVTPA